MLKKPAGHFDGSAQSVQTLPWIGETWSTETRDLAFLEVDAISAVMW